MRRDHTKNRYSVNNSETFSNSSNTVDIAEGQGNDNGIGYTSELVDQISHESGKQQNLQSNQNFNATEIDHDVDKSKSSNMGDNQFSTQKQENSLLSNEDLNNKNWQQNVKIDNDENFTADNKITTQTSELLTQISQEASKEQNSLRVNDKQVTSNIVRLNTSSTSETQNTLFDESVKNAKQATELTEQSNKHALLSWDQVNLQTSLEELIANFDLWIKKRNVEWDQKEQDDYSQLKTEWSELSGPLQKLVKSQFEDILKLANTVKCALKTVADELINSLAQGQDLHIPNALIAIEIFEKRKYVLSDSYDKAKFNFALMNDIVKLFTDIEQDLQLSRRVVFNLRQKYVGGVESRQVIEESQQVLTHLINKYAKFEEQFISSDFQTSINASRSKSEIISDVNDIIAATQRLRNLTNEFRKIKNSRTQASWNQLSIQKLRGSLLDRSKSLNDTEREMLRALTSRYQELNEEMEDFYIEQKNLESSIKNAQVYLQDALQTLTQILRSNGTNYKLKSEINYDEVIGQEKWETIKEQARKSNGIVLTLETDHIYAVKRIKLLEGIADILTIYRTTNNQSVKENIIYFLKSLGDEAMNHMRINKLANNLKKERPWKECNYQDFIKFGYTPENWKELQIKEDQAEKILKSSIQQFIIEINK